MKNTIKNFIFTTNTNAFQVEGGRHLGKRKDSIWDKFTKENYYIPPVGSPEREINSIEIAADLFHQYKIDAQLCKHVGMNSFAYNMDWTRIFPNNSTDVNMEGVKFYQDFFAEFNKVGIKIIPTLFHWDTPLWAEKLGGFANRDVIKWFRNYVKVCFQYFGKYADYWFVSDENSSFTMIGYLSDYFPPQKTDKTDFVKAVHYLAMCSAVTKQEFIKAKQKGWVNKKAILGVDHDWSPGITYSKAKVDVEATKKYDEWFLGLYYDPYLLGTYPKIFYDFIKDNKIKFTIPKKDLEFLKKYTVDLIGWNYYRPAYIASVNTVIPKEKKKSESHPTNQFKIVYPDDGKVRYTKWNWVINPYKIIYGLEVFKKRYGNLPVMIMENGTGDFDDKSKEMIIDVPRIQYLQEHIKQIMLAVNKGLNIIGYAMWTYCDIFSPSGGYRKDYGLVNVDFNSDNRVRKPKLSYSWFKQVIKSYGQDLSINLTKLKKELKEDIKFSKTLYK